MSRTLGPLDRSLAIAVLAFFVLCGPGCGDEDGPRAENQAPTARLTAGPVLGDTTNYQVRLSWTGSDPDGFIAGYQYALDPPAQFTEAEIAAGTLGIKETFLPGANGAPDTTRVSKLVGAVPYSFDWIHTQEFSRLFRFSAGEPESIEAGTVLEATGRFLGLHAVYVRAVDDEGARSLPDRVAFAAETLAPVTGVTRPRCDPGEILVLGSSILLDWQGEDADADAEGAARLRYECKLVEIASITLPRLTDPGAVLLGDASPWVSVDPDSLPLRLALAVPRQYLLGVRAIDEAGAVEPFFDFGRNALRLITRAQAGVPVLTLACELGSFEFIGMGYPREAETMAGVPLRVTITATAETYGETVAGWRWGLDLADVEKEEGWSAWTQDPTLPPLTIPQAGVHALLVEARDSAGGLTRATLILQVVDAPMDRPLLWVDDSRDLSYPSDAQHDAFWNGLIQDSGRFDMASEVFRHEVHGPSDVYSPVPLPPTLEQLGRYRLIVWECAGAGYNGQSGLLSSSTLRRHLGAYLRAGGQLWVGGTMTVPAMMASPNGVNFNPLYPIDATGDQTSFAYRFMKLASSRINNAMGIPPDDNLIGVQPFPGKTPIYVQMEQDPAKVSPIKASISHGDAIFDPIYAQDAGFTGVIDSLFVYQAKRAGSAYNNKLNAIRWHDPDPARPHGRTQWFGFPLYFMKKEQAQETFNRSIDWFREEARP